jgi:hypothetical protein
LFGQSGKLLCRKVSQRQDRAQSGEGRIEGRNPVAGKEVTVSFSREILARSSGEDFLFLAAADRPIKVAVVE